MYVATKNSATSQPPVIPIFLAAEMWERFGFYIIQGLLVLYMTSTVFGFSDIKSYAILGSFSAFSFFTPILGGYIATRVLDYEHAITLGGCMLAIGYAFLSLPHEKFFYIGLSIIAVGNGFFKPSVSSYLGDFYRQNDPNRERGYTLLYVGINVGVLLATSTSGYLVRYFGWHIPFLFASFGLVIGTATFVFGIYFLKMSKNFQRLNSSVAFKNPFLVAFVYVLAFVLVIVCYQFIRYQVLANRTMLWSGIAVFLGLMAYAMRYKKDIRNKLLACFFLTLIAVVFWATFMQMFFSINLFVERVVNRHVFSFDLPTPLFISLESIYIVIFGPLLGKLWSALSIKKRNPGLPLKFTFALFAVGVALIVMYCGAKSASISGIITSPWYIIVAYFFLTMGELFISPIGFAMVTTLVPQELVGLVMGVWIVAIGFGVKLANVYANYAIIPKNIHSIAIMGAIYAHAYLHFAALAFACGFIAFAAIPFINRLLRG